MRRRAVRIEFRDADDRSGWLEGVVADMQTRDRAEFLLVEAGPDRVSLRLDHLLAIFDGEHCVYRRQNSVDNQCGL